MGNILSKILTMIENLLIVPLIWLFPLKWTVVPPGSTAVRFTWGHPGHDLFSGTHFATTFQTFVRMHTLLNMATAEQMFVLTSDGLSLRVRGVALYTITNLSKFLTCSDDSEQLMIEMCEASIRSVLSNTTFDDLVRESEMVEKRVSSTLGLIGRSIGIRIRRYRFQDIQIVDPLARAMSSSAGMISGLVKTCKKMADDGDVSFREALMILSPNVTYTADVMSSIQDDSEYEAGSVDLPEESEG